MKELSIEEKARRYDEAKYIMKEYLESGNAGVIAENTIKKAFPELKESEDERIRKLLVEAVIQVLQDQYCSNRGVSKEKVVAWLERRGEQKPIDMIEPKFKVGDKIYLKPEYRMPDDDTPIANTVFEIRVIDDKHYRFDGSYIFIEDQDKYELVEQKPAWSGENENIIEWLIGYLEYQIMNATITEEKDNCLDAISMLKSLKERVQSQPKQEWSEEDERLFQIVIDILDRENHLGNISHTDLIACVRKLKSLRPQVTWKPSDEQIEILDMVLTNASMDDNIARILRELREQLKKLREE